MYDLERLAEQGKQVAAIAREMLAGQRGIIEGSRLLAQLRPSVTRDDFDADFLTFIAIASQTDALPVGAERELWASSALAEKEQEIRRAEDHFREQALAGCRALIARFEG